MTAPAFTDQERLIERAPFEEQLHEYRHGVDRNWGRNAASYYTSHAVFGGEAAT